MIYTEQAQFQKIAGFSPLMQKAISFLEKTNLALLPLGRVDIAGDDIYANCFEYLTKPLEETEYESHMQYIDIHVLLSGEERIDVALQEDLKQTKLIPEEDCALYMGEEQATVYMTQGKVLLVFPGEAHRVKIALWEPIAVKKLVVKVKM